MLSVLLAGAPAERLAEWAQPKPKGEMRWALYVTLSPSWFDEPATSHVYLRLER